MPAKRYFEFSEGSSNKFWEVWCEGAEVFTRYGKIGADGQLTVKKLPSKAAAQLAHDALVREKTRKGYAEKGAKKAAAKSKSDGKAEPVAPARVEVPENGYRLECIDGKSSKFYQVHVDGKNLIVTYGKIGTEGKTEKKKVKEEWAAKWEMKKLVDQKLAKGYVHYVPPDKTKVTPTQNAQLEAQIAKDPANDDNFAVYSDWLQEQGDVRGELASLQIQAAAKPKDKKLQNAIAKLLGDYRSYFWGPFAAHYDPDADEDDRAVGAVWRAGWIDELELGAPSEYGESKTPEVNNVSELVRGLANVPSAKFVRSIVITKPVSDSEYNFAPAVEELVKVMPKLPALRRLEIGRFSYEDSELSWANMGPLGRLWPVAKQLEYLKLRSGSMTLGKIVAPSLREFRVETGGLDKADAKSIANAQWPKLERLDVWFGKERYGCNASVKDIAPIFEAKGLGKLKHLGLKNSQFGNEIFAAIAKSRILRQLETLDLSMSHITTDALKADILPHQAAFAHLASLDVSDCRLDKEGQKLAKQLCKKVEVGGQNEPSDWEDEDYRYASVGE